MIGRANVSGKVRLSFEEAHRLALKKYGQGIGMFGRLLTNGGNAVAGKFISYGLNKIITRDELLSYRNPGGNEIFEVDGQGRRIKNYR
jgi:hypothetical protein